MQTLNSRWLHTFTTLCEVEHFTQAAARLNMTQPGVSQHVKKLEGQLGSQLIERGAPGFVLTDAGEQVFRLGRNRRAEEADLQNTLLADEPDTGTVHLACSGSFAMMLYPETIQWMQASPAISVYLEAAPESAITEGIINQRFDLGIVGTDTGNPIIDSEMLGKECLDLILPRSTGIVRPSFAELQTLGLVLHPDGEAYADLILGANFENEYEGIEKLVIRSFVNQIGQIPSPVASGVGYTILPQSGILAFPDTQAITVASLAKPGSQELYLIRRKGRSLPRRVAKLAEMVRGIATKLGSASDAPHN